MCVSYPCLLGYGTHLLNACCAPALCQIFCQYYFIQLSSIAQ